MAEIILQRLGERDTRLNSFVADVFLNYQGLYRENKELETRKQLLETENTMLKKSSSDPTTIENLRSQISDLQTRLTSSYEELTKNQALILKRTDEAAEATAKCKELEKARDAANELAQNLLTQLEKRDKLVQELNNQVAALKEERNQLATAQDKLLEKVTRIENENNQLINRMRIDKQNMIDQWNELNNMMEDLNKKKTQFEEQRKLFEENKAKFLALKKGAGVDEESKMDLKIFYTSTNKSKEGKTEFNPMNKIKLHSAEIYAVAESYVKNIVATAGGDKTIKFFDPHSNSVISTLKATNSNQVYISLAIDKTNDLLLAGATDKTAQIWSITSERVKHTLNGHQDRVTACSFAYDKDRCVTGSADRTIKIWDVNKGNIIKTVMCGSSCTSLKVAKDNLRIISAHTDRSVKIFSLKTGEQIASFKDIHDSAITSIDLTEDNNLILTCSRDNTLRLIDLRMNKALSIVLRHDAYMCSCDYSKACFVDYDKSVAAGGLDGKVYVWNVEDGKLQGIFDGGHESYITGCCYNFLSGYLYSTDVKGNVVVWQ